VNCQKLLKVDEDVIKIDRPSKAHRDGVFLLDFQIFLSCEDKRTKVVVGGLVHESLVSFVESRQISLVFSEKSDVSRFVEILPDEVAVVEETIGGWITSSMPIVGRLTSENRKEVREGIVCNLLLISIRFDEMESSQPQTYTREPVKFEPSFSRVDFIVDHWQASLQIRPRDRVQSKHHLENVHETSTSFELNHSPLCMDVSREFSSSSVFSPSPSVA
jgi:hypothetical protein